MAIKVIALEQFGFAIIPWCSSRASGLISGTTKGTDGSILNAELLSITTQFLFTASWAYFTELSEPALKIAKSSPSKDSGVVSRTVLRSPNASTSVPADLGEARSLTSLAGNSLFSRSLIISWPTAPVEPTMPILNFFNEYTGKE